jgi:hypothetical protein
MSADRVPVTFETTTRDGCPWKEWDEPARYENWDWLNAWKDAGGTVFGPGTYLKVQYIGSNPDMAGIVSRVRPKRPRKTGKWDFEPCTIEESPTGWVMVRK